MPKFLYTILFATFVLLGTLFFLMFNKNPHQPYMLPLFLATILLSLTFILSMLFFFISKRKAGKDAREIRAIYRTSFKKSLFVSVYVLGVMILRINNVASVLTLSLYSLAYLISPYLLSKLFR